MKSAARQPGWNARAKKSPHGNAAEAVAANAVLTIASLRGHQSSEAGSTAWTAGSKSTQATHSTAGIASSNWRNEAGSNSLQRMENEPGTRPTTMNELRSQLLNDAPNRTGHTWERRLSTALGVIDDIPEHVADALYNRAVSISDGVTGELEPIRRQIHDSDSMSEASVTKVSASLEDIPYMVFKSFENKFVKVKASARSKVKKLIQQLEASDFGSEHIVEQMWTIPEEVRQIAANATDEAIQDTQSQVSDLLDMLIEPASESGGNGEDTISRVKKQIVAQIPHVARSAEGSSARAAAVDAVQHAVAAIKNIEKHVHPVRNRIVADTILRAKVELPRNHVDMLCRSGSLVDDRDASNDADNSIAGGRRLRSFLQPYANASETFSRLSWADMSSERDEEDSTTTHRESVNSLGSVGHPELCSRPCLYYASGTCTNGNDCGFCHLVHNPRQAHLDKRNRESLRNMSFAKCVSLMHPRLKSKMQQLQFSDEAMEDLEKLRSSTETSGVAMQGSAKALRSLVCVFDNMTLRSLLTTLQSRYRVGADLASSEWIALDNLLQRIKVETGLHGTWPPSA